MKLAELLQWNLTLFLLIFCRWAGMVMIAPVFGARGVPNLVKLGLAMALSVVLYPTVLSMTVQVPVDTLLYIGLIIKEVTVGLVIGLVINLLTSVMQTAGELIDYQIGFTLGNTIDPINGMQSPMTGNFLMVLTTMLLLAINAHHLIIAAMVKSYSYIPVNTGILPKGMTFYIQIVGQVIALGAQIAMPIFGALFLADVGVGLLSKTVPQLNIFSVIFPVKIIFGLTLLFLSIPYLGSTVSNLTDIVMNWVFQLYRGWTP
ncbi:flagellar biosynthetic protein FliR [Syntrophobotulus glycolicus DSM 8271]|uniref:Flagellar biosynthetic protein FliR n=1 Tax=Syntrophobotulus glycolicus (strain DSM 8271 / FlGlyR) TaxID=645991 RepID=F0SZW0_SYNGF|nr:flagellar biosynthetic protein FliR [Syntrophobotulus glycolicus]ADY54971.1 flagellar biosynthetic protein FliR [Syntrophobotulus glycolicus DSM 8271]